MKRRRFLFYVVIFMPVFGSGLLAYGEETEIHVTNSEEYMDGEVDAIESHRDIKKDNQNMDQSQESQLQSLNPLQQRDRSGGVLHTSILSNLTLDAHHTIENGKDHISLQLSGQALLEVDLLSDKYVVFQLPAEISAVVNQDSIEASYDVPAVGLLGIPIVRDRGDFDKEDIVVDGNAVYLNFKKLLSLELLNLGGSPNYNFTLSFDVIHLPPSDFEVYTFYGSTTNQLIDIGVIEINEFASAEIPVLDFPEGELTFHYIPETLAFETTEVPTETVIIQRKDPNWYMEVKDTRREKGDWKIVAEASPLTSIEKPENRLYDALVFINEKEEQRSLSTEAITVFSGVPSSNEITRVFWEADEGPLLQVSPGEVMPGEYETTITWTLIDAP